MKPFVFDGSKAVVWQKLYDFHCVTKLINELACRLKGFCGIVEFGDNRYPYLKFSACGSYFAGMRILYRAAHR